SWNPRNTYLVLVSFFALVFLGLVFYPSGQTLLDTFFPGGQLSFQAFQHLARSRGLSVIVWNTFVYTVGTLVLSSVIGVVVAWANERTDARVERLAGILPILPLMGPPIGSAL